MAQDLADKILRLRTELTRLVRDGFDEDGLTLRRRLAELERLENQQLALRNCPTVGDDRRAGGSHGGMAI